MALIRIAEEVVLEDIDADAKVYVESDGAFGRASLDDVVRASRFGLYIDEDGDVCQEDR